MTLSQFLVCFGIQQIPDKNCDCYRQNISIILVICDFLQPSNSSRLVEMLQINYFLGHFTLKNIVISYHPSSPPKINRCSKNLQDVIFTADKGGTSFYEHLYGPFESAVDCINIVCKPISTLFTIIGGVHIAVADFEDLSEIANNTKRYLFEWVYVQVFEATEYNLSCHFNL